MRDIHDFCPLWGDWYVVGTKLGEGAFGSVWKIQRRDPTLGIVYAAVKHISIPKDEQEVRGLIQEGIISNSDSARKYYQSMIDALKQEIGAMFKLRGYTNLVSYEDHLIIPKDDGIGCDLFLRMELLTPLSDVMRGEMPVKEVVKLGIDIATAIDVLNKHGYVHRDIKPQNVFVNEIGNYELGDYGTVRSLQRPGTMSQKGTPYYMAPEIYLMKKADWSVDVYSLGIMLYWLLNGNRLPFVSASGEDQKKQREESFVRRMDGAPLPPPDHADEELAAIVLKACAYRPEDRYPNANAFRKALMMYDVDHNERREPVRPISSVPQISSASSPPRPTQDKNTVQNESHSNRTPSVHGRPRHRSYLVPVLIAVFLLVMAGGMAAYGLFFSKRPNLTPAHTAATAAIRAIAPTAVLTATSTPALTAAPTPSHTAAPAPTTAPAAASAAATEHVHTVEILPAKAATCIDSGLTEGEKCSVCGEVLIPQATIPATGHQAEKIPGKAATCTEPGLTEGEKCSVCGEVLIPQTAIPVTGHQAEKIPSKAATCTEPGLTEGEKCAVCGELLIPQTIIPTTGHQAEKIPGTAATCTEPGLTEGEKCAVCGELLIPQTEIPAIGHQAEIIPGKEATCTEPGLTEGEKCSICGGILLPQNSIPAAGHKPTTIYGWDATCTESGMSDGEKCSVCGIVLAERKYIPAGHKTTTISGRAATCTEPGLTEGKKCYVCGTVLAEQTSIPAKGHTPQTIPGSEPTCFRSGRSAGVKCSVCGMILEAQAEIPALGHDFSVEKEHYYETDGPYITETTVYECSRCNSTFTKRRTTYNQQNEDAN